MNLSEADVADDACKKMRPTTPNEVAAMMKNRLCRNKHRTDMKFLKNQVDQESNQLVKKRIEMEQLMLNISKKNVIHEYPINFLEI